MPGLGMNIGGYGGVTTGTALPSAASQPGSQPVAIKAFGVTAAGEGGSAWAAQGAVVAGIVGAALLVFLWHSLPR